MNTQNLTDILTKANIPPKLAELVIPLLLVPQEERTPEQQALINYAVSLISSA